MVAVLAAPVEYVSAAAGAAGCEEDELDETLAIGRQPALHPGPARFVAHPSASAHAAWPCVPLYQ
eukprot:6083468-Prymnesium_polylepis.1